MQPPKMTFRSELEPSIKSYECFMFFCKISEWKSQWTDGFLKEHNRFFSFKNRERVKMHSTQKNATSKNDL